MSGETGAAGDGAPSRARVRAVVATVGFALVICALAVALSAAAVAQEEDDTDPPQFENATKGDLTTIVLTISDDTDVDESSISAADFALSTGHVADVTANDTGNRTRVRIELSEVVPQSNVTVSIAENRTITDAAGNRLRDASVTVTGMDGYRPQLQAFELERLDESRVRVRVVSSEPLSELYVGVGGPGADTLTMANFTRRGDPAAFRFPYVANLTLPQEGEYDVLVGTMVDRNGVKSRYSIEKTVLVDRTPPTPSIDAPARTPDDVAVTFSAKPSTDEFGIARYNWSVDGNHTASGPSFEHTFRTPGYHGVTLTVTDRRNNTATTTFPILVEGEATRSGVEIRRRNASSTTVHVGPNRTTERVSIAGTGDLLGTTAVDLESIAVDVPVNESASLELSTADNASAWFETTGATTLAGFDIAHEKSLSTATFRFSVNRSALDAAGVAPADVTLYREVDRWRPIYTMEVGRNASRITYEATAAGLSRFVVGGAGGGSDGTGSTGNATAGNATTGNTTAGAGTSGNATTGNATTGNATAGDATAGNATAGNATAGNASAGNATAGNATSGNPTTGADRGTAARIGDPDIRIANSTLLTDSVDGGERVIVRATARNRGNATGSYVVGFVVNNTVLTTTNVTVPPGENRTVTFVRRVETGGTVVVNGTIAGTLSVGGNASAAKASSGGLPIPNPIALWPGGLFGRALGAIFWFVVILYGVLKALAIYLGY